MSYKQDLARTRNGMKWRLLGIKGLMRNIKYTHLAIKITSDELSKEYDEMSEIESLLQNILDRYNERSKELGLKIKEIKIDDTI